VDLGCRWRADATFDATVIQVALDPPLERSIDPETEQSALPSRARSLVAELLRETSALEIHTDMLSAEIASPPVRDPAALEARVDRLARLARALTGRGESGPFR
jgi:hypothetical protein